MVAPPKRRPSTRQTAVAQSIPAPVGGWNARDSLANMPATDAVTLINWIPRATYCEFRRGFQSWVTGTAAAVETLMVWRGGTQKMLACAGANIYDVTAQGSLGAAAWTTSTSARYRYVSFGNDAGTWIVAANGVDHPIKFDGTTVTATSFTGTVGSRTLTDTTINNLMMHKGRLHLVEGGSCRVWYPTTINAIAGACGLLDLGPVFSKGGQIICLGTWTLDGGNGPDDYAVYMTDQGQVAVYKGTDPSSSTTWALVGVFDLGAPLSNRALVRYGSDMTVVTTDGLMPFSQALSRDRAAEEDASLTIKIKDAYLKAVQAYKGNLGWEAILYPRGQLILLNVPLSSLGTSEQYVQNTQTGAWARFTGWNAYCWAICNDLLFFGSTAGIYQADVGSSDNGVVISGEVKSAFSAFGMARQKQFTMVRPLLYAPTIVQPALDVNVDYQDSTPTSVPTVVDAGSTTPVMRYDWTSVSGIGWAAAPHLALSLTGTPAANQIFIDTPGVDNLVTGDGFDVLTSAGLPFDVPVQLIGFDLMFKPGGEL